MLKQIRSEKKRTCREKIGQQLTGITKTKGTTGLQFTGKLKIKRTNKRILI